MSAGILLIDGYNLLHAAGMGQKDYRPGDLLRCRTRLLRLLVDKLSAAEIHATTVVFDARDPPRDRPTQVVVSGIRILFANPGGDADVLIQNWLAHHPSPRRVTLVSSDRVLQCAARSSGAKFLGSRDFLDTLDRRKGAKPASRTGPLDQDDDATRERHASAGHVAYWLKVFGDVPVVEPDPDDQRESPVPRTVAPKSKPATGSLRPRRSHRPRAADDSKPAGNVAGEELAYWMNVFAQSAPGEESSAAYELRLSDLENWLKVFEAAERGAANRRE
jgi:predicted RNA-binding protein with PIN domain